MRIVVLALLASCAFKSTTQTPTEDAAPGDDTPDQATIDAAIDAAIDARVCPIAPGGCVAFACAGSPSCYYACGISSGKLNWSNARDACANSPMGGCITTVNDEMEQACITASAMPTFQNNNFVWIGYRQDPGHSEPAGSWAWECPPSSFTAPNWNSGGVEPNNEGNEDCAAMTDSGAWFDAACGEEARYVCEVP